METRLEDVSDEMLLILIENIDSANNNNVILNLQELYHGRFTQEEIKTILVQHDWNDGEAISFIQENEPATVRQTIQRLSEDQIRDIQSDPDIVRALADGVTTQTRLFSCKDCDRFWWRKVPHRKQVSKCHRCLVKYDPVPRENEWGWAIFTCECGNEFSGHGQLQVGSECYKCGNIAYATEIRPPTRRRTRQTRSTHSCNAPDCNGCDDGMTGSENAGATGGQEVIYNRSSESQNETNNGYRAGYGRGDPPGRYQRGYPSRGRGRGPVMQNVCVSPESRQGKPKVIFASRRHVSTGSTVATFLDQDDILSMDSYVTSLPVIRE